MVINVFKRNSGKFRYQLTFLKPQVVEDRLGGKRTEYVAQDVIIFADIENRSYSERDILGDSINTNTLFALVRDLREVFPDLTNDWQVEWGNIRYSISQIDFLFNTNPTLMQLTINKIGDKPQVRY